MSSCSVSLNDSSNLQDLKNEKIKTVLKSRGFWELVSETSLLPYNPTNRGLRLLFLQDKKKRGNFLGTKGLSHKLRKNVRKVRVLDWVTWVELFLVRHKYLKTRKVHVTRRSRIGPCNVNVTLSRLPKGEFMDRPLHLG